MYMLVTKNKQIAIVERTWQIIFSITDITNHGLKTIAKYLDRTATKRKFLRFAWLTYIR